MAKNQAQEAEAKSNVRRASLEDLKNKRPLQKTVTIQSGDEQLEIVLQSIGRKAYSDLVDECSKEVDQPVLDDKGEPKKDDEDNVITEKTETLDEELFFPALVAASLSAAGLEVTVEDVNEWVDDWNSTEFDELAMGAFEVNTRNKVALQGKG